MRASAIALPLNTKMLIRTPTVTQLTKSVRQSGSSQSPDVSCRQTLRNVRYDKGAQAGRSAVSV
jgi:hypothetical protein